MAWGGGVTNPRAPCPVDPPLTPPSPLSGAITAWREQTRGVGKGWRAGGALGQFGRGGAGLAQGPGGGCVATPSPKSTPAIGGVSPSLQANPPIALALLRLNVISCTLGRAGGSTGCGGVRAAGCPIPPYPPTMNVPPPVGPSPADGDGWPSSAQGGGTCPGLGVAPAAPVGTSGEWGEHPAHPGVQCQPYRCPGLTHAGARCHSYTGDKVKPYWCPVPAQTGG